MRAYSDDKIIDLVEEYMRGSESPDLKCYRDQTYQRDFADKTRYLWSLECIARLGDYRDKRILDVGCGFGWQAFTTSLLDSENRVVAIDILPSMFDGMSDCIAYMHKKDVTFSIEPMCGDICALDLEPGSFDAIYSIEAIEHVHDMERMVQRCFKLLRPGGNLILVNDQNILNRKVRDDTVRMWNERESSWTWSEYLRSIRPIEHKDARPFAVMREEIAKAAKPDLEPWAVKRIVDATAGLLKPEIEAIAADFTIDAPLPVRPAYDWCRNPITGEYAERLFDPFALAKLLQHAGFRTKVLHLFRRFPLSLVNSVQFRPLNLILFSVRPAFIVYGEKI